MTERCDATLVINTELGSALVECSKGKHHGMYHTMTDGRHVTIHWDDLAEDAHRERGSTS